MGHRDATQGQRTTRPGTARKPRDAVAVAILSWMDYPASEPSGRSKGDLGGRGSMAGN